MNETIHKLSINLKIKDTKHCGSRVTCNPPPIDTDDDYLILIDENELDNLFNYDCY